MTTMAAFQPVNPGLAPNDHVMDHHDDATTPTTPRPPPSTAPPRAVGVSSPGTTTGIAGPAQDNGGMSGQRALPTSPFPGAPSADSSQGTLSRENSQKSVQSDRGADDRDDSGDEGGQDGSDIDTDVESGRPSKKKKGQRFFCTQYPPCTLSFTRSEHLARHIRKHTGERPFQCHCARRFSRLDNLRQHAQTVHLNEEIPNDSLAATGTRFQRQIRTDRVRPPGGRARSGTGGSQGSHSRGHSRNLSTSSIGSTASNFSTSTQEPRRRPPPLIMANDPSARARLSLDTMASPPSTPPSQYRGASGQSPSGMTTPTSATFSTGPGSPYYGSSIGSPASNASRPAGYFGNRTPARRLSVPSGANPFQSPHGSTYPPPYVSPLASSNASYSNNSSVYASPTASNYGFVRNDPNIAADADWRRRTWHPSSHSYHPRPATSGLSFFQTPDAPQPAFAQNATAAAGQAPRLPGIESFDRPSTPPRRGPSPMQIDSAPAPPSYGAPSAQTGAQDPRRGHASWDMSLHSNLTRLDLQGGQSKDAAQWGQQTMNELENATQRPGVSYQADNVARSGAPVVVHQQQRPGEPPQADPVTPTRIKRQGWYNGPFPTPTQMNQLSRPSPEDSSSSEGVQTPGTSTAEINPAIVHSSGYIEPQHHAVAADMGQNSCAPTLRGGSYQIPQQSGSQPMYVHGPPNPQNDISRLEALVAVATGEDKVATAR